MVIIEPVDKASELEPYTTIVLGALDRPEALIVDDTTVSDMTVGLTDEETDEILKVLEWKLSMVIKSNYRIVDIARRLKERVEKG